MFVPVLLLLVIFLMTGCKGEKSAGAKEEMSAEKKTEEISEEVNLKLTEKELIAFMKAYPVFVDITKKKGEEVKPLADKDNLLSGMKMAGELKEYKEEVDKALKDYGFTLESFYEAYGKVMGAVFYGTMNEAMKQSGAEMKKILDNPDIPEESKAEIRESLKEMEETEESEEMKANKENWKIVEKHKEELKKIFEENE
jgi:hypothetical protein